MSLQLSLAFLSGACLVLGAVLLAGLVGADPYVDRPLPTGLRTILDWGRRPPSFDLYRPRPLPRRVPGATRIPEPLPPHTNDVADYVSPSRWIPRRLWLWWVRKLNEFSVMESDEAFARWWEDTWVTNRKYQHHGRHRLDERDDRAWREQHAAIPTSEWPTLATTAYAAEIIDLDVRPMICVGPRLPNGLSSLLQIESSLPVLSSSEDSQSSELAYVT